MKRVLIAVMVLVVAGFLIKTVTTSSSHETVNYRLVDVEQGNLESVVSATGTLDAVTTISIGTQVSGIIREICVDYNDVVKAGQVIGRIDKTLLSSAVASAQTQLTRSEAELKHAQREFTRIAALHKESLVSDSEFNTAQYSLDIAQTSVDLAKIDLARSQQNLSYATITSPIDGTIIARTVDVGQTVQASFSAPELFLIAGDLTRMQILASVDESDIGEIAEGQAVNFTVQAYPDYVFTGEVRQVRLQSTNQENVVNYTAVVDVANTDGRLLPGMTATVDFLVETATDVLYVANAALRYKPDQETVAAAFEKMRAERESKTSSSDRPDRQRRGDGPPSGMSASQDRGTLWVVNQSGDVSVIPVATGISDGTNTAVRGRLLEVGQQVIAGVSSSASAANSTSSPFQQQNSGQKQGPPRGGGF